MTVVHEPVSGDAVDHEPEAGVTGVQISETAPMLKPNVMKYVKPGVVLGPMPSDMMSLIGIRSRG